MRIFSILIGVFVTLSCTNQDPTKTTGSSVSRDTTSKVSTPNQVPDSNKWKKDFLEFSKAVISGDKNVVKKFIDFPIKNEGNEIWLLADSKLVMEIDPDKIKPFTEADYDKYFSSIFAMDLRKTLEKLNNEQLFRTHESTSPEIEVVKDVKSITTATYDKANNKLTLVLNNKGEEFETSIIYQFDVNPKQKLKFRQVRMAG